MEPLIHVGRGEPIAPRALVAFTISIFSPTEIGHACCDEHVFLFVSCLSGSGKTTAVCHRTYIQPVYGCIGGFRMVLGWLQIRLGREKSHRFQLCSVRWSLEVGK